MEVSDTSRAGWSLTTRAAYLTITISSDSSLGILCCDDGGVGRGGCSCGEEGDGAAEKMGRRENVRETIQ